MQPTDMIEMDQPGRLLALRECLDRDGLDGLIVTKPVNVRWLSGFTGSNGLLVITAGRGVLVTDGRYTEQAGRQIAAAKTDFEIEINNDSTAVVASILADAARPEQAATDIGVEGGHLTIDRHQLLDAAVSARLVSTSDLIEGLRQIKDRGEVARLQSASAVADQAFATVFPLLETGITERRFGAELDHQMRLAGADDVSFETIVGSGPNGALPHARPSDRVIELGDLVVIDFGASIDGYGSDMTRTVVAGGQPSDEQVELYEAVAAAQRAGVAAVRAGVHEADIDAACRGELESRGLGEAFIHGTGHGIGLEIHEQPILSSRAVGILRAGLVITVEPGAYLPGFGGVRVEDSVVVTDSGCEPITHSPKGLVPDFTPPYR